MLFSLRQPYIWFLFRSRAFYICTKAWVWQRKAHGTGSKAHGNERKTYGIGSKKHEIQQGLWE